MLDAGLPVRAFFTTRAGGGSASPYASLNLAVHVGDAPEAVARNRDAVATHAGAPVSFLHAEHGARVVEVTTPGEDPAPGDVLVTRTPGVAIAAIAADCVPVLLHDALTGAVAAVHAGREGVRVGAIDAALDALLAMRAPAHRADAAGVSASIGPAICGRCYEVPETMREAVAALHPAARSTTRHGTPALDLPRALAARLEERGVGRVIRTDLCTFEDPTLFSHRRDGVTGRHAGVIICGVSVPGSAASRP